MTWRFSAILFWLAIGCSPAQGATWKEERVAVPDPAREFRGAWFTTVYNLDWPSHPGLPKEAQQQELKGLLDAAARLGLNAVLLQVRPGGDAVYASAREPWSAILTGKSGGDPGYDPLLFAIDEAHRRGLELHAWFNPFRAKTGKNQPDPKHWTVLHPEWIRGDDSHLIMDPGIPGVQTQVLEVMRDVLTRYDIDGIHIDDYFYPYPVFGPGAVRKEVPLGDEALWQKTGGGQSLADWRRGNINRFIQSLYTLTKSVKPAARVGISPFGIWQPGIPAGIEARVSAYDHLYGDSRRWLQEGWCDYLAPQLYWPIQPAKQSFTALLEWWTAQSKGRPVWPGVSAERVASTKAPVLDLNEVNNQLTQVRRIAPAPGSVLWRIKSLASDTRGIGTLLRNEIYAERALPPPAPWLGAEAPGTPQVKVEDTPENVRISWTAGTGTPARWWAVQTLTAGKWTLQPAVFQGTNTLIFAGTADAVAVRPVSASGVAGAVVTWKKAAL